MNHLFLLTAAAFVTGVCTACHLYIRLKEDAFLSIDSDNFPVISNKKLEWKITKVYNLFINLSVTFQDTSTNKFLAVNTGNEIKLIDGARNNIWRRTFELQKLGNETFKMKTWISSATDGINKVMLSGNKLILSDLDSLFYAEVIGGCEEIFPGVFITTSTTAPKTTSIPPKIISSLEQLIKFDHRKSRDNDKVIMDNILNIEMQGLSAASNLSIGSYVEATSSIADIITSKQKLPFKFGVVNQSSSKNEIEVTGESEEFMAVFAAKYKDIHRMFSDDIEIKDTGMAREERYIVNSVLLSAAIANQSVVDKVTIKLQHLNKSVATDSVCAFWNQSGRGFWSTVGCQKLQSSNYSTTCLCSHLTNFAILALVEKFPISETHQMVLSIITLVFSGLSMFFLIIGIIIILLILIGYKKQTRHIIHLNLMVTLLFAQTVFVFGAEAVENKAVCKLIAYILHYFWLASFGWMLIEGVYLYVLVLKVFAEPKKYMKWYFLIAWGMPLIIVGITSLTNSKAYSTSSHCWLSNSHHAIWAFLGPILGIITINGIILLLVLVQIIKLTKSNKLNDNLRAGFRSSVILLPILGVTWIFGFLTFGSETIFFQYVFAVLNSSQGFLLTLFHCLLNEEVFTGFKRRLAVLFYSSKFPQVKQQSPLLSSFRTSEFSFAQQNVSRSEKSSHIQSSSFS